MCSAGPDRHREENRWGVPRFIRREVVSAIPEDMCQTAEGKAGIPARDRRPNRGR